MAALIRALPVPPRGSVRFWGDPFGRPGDNDHRVVSCRAQGDVLHLGFDEDERATVWAPTGLTIAGRGFRIRDADGVRWEWYHYGRPKTPENLRFYEYAATPRGVIVTTNAPWAREEERRTIRSEDALAVG